ncbi:MAG TPA: L,D-transpeptidase [Thermoflexales bacterium]|nr:L,D-transpeptidase [Thermoflexales bacterium]HQW36616.1 L,D-transpeptidase [Thermoflexales bacterium]HQZ99655.1 L,D-transpeptidase [Thermoflexales bacterium]
MVTRRRFIKGVALSSAVIAARTFLHYTPAYAKNPQAMALMDAPNAAPPASLGRVTAATLPIHAAPDAASPAVGQYARDDVFSVLAHINNAWFQSERGFVAATQVQPVENAPQNALAPARTWGEICAPFADARTQPRADAPIFYRLYYASVFRIAGVAKDAAGNAWYQLREGLRRDAFIPAAHLRPISLDDLTPLSPEVKNKRIEVNTTINLMRAYEDDKIALETRVATGKLTLYTYTPNGSFRVISKKPSAHMMGLWGTPDYYDLPGVPFATFFTPRGAAIHGAYWHNDYGSHRSHGCVNVPPAIARWYWRWTTPAAPYDSAEYYAAPGTPVIVSKT